MKVYKRAALPSETVGEDLLIVDAERDLFFNANAVGVLIWDVLEAPHTAAEVADRVIETCTGSSTDEVHADVQEFIDAMCQEGIVEVVSESGKAS